MFSLLLTTTTTDVMQAVAAFQAALQYNPQNVEVSRKIKRLTQLARDKKRAQEVETMRSNIDMRKYLDPMKSELVSVLHNSYIHMRVFLLYE